MKKVYFLIIVFSSFTSLSLYAQDGYIAKSVTDLGLELNWSKRVQPPAYAIEGTPYYNDEFIKGEVYFEGKFVVKDVPLRYNMNNDEMEFQEKNFTMAIASPEKIDKVIIGKDTFIYVDQSQKKLVEGFVKKWNEGYPSIITKMEVVFLEKEAPKAIVESKPARYVRSFDEQFIMKSPSEIERIKSVKQLIQALGSHESELTEFYKKEKISFKDGEELSKLVAYYLSLN